RAGLRFGGQDERSIVLDLSGIDLLLGGNHRELTVGILALQGIEGANIELGGAAMNPDRSRVFGGTVLRIDDPDRSDELGIPLIYICELVVIEHGGVRLPVDQDSHRWSTIACEQAGAGSSCRSGEDQLLDGAFGQAL